MEFARARLRLRNGSAIPSKTTYARIRLLEEGWVRVEGDVRGDADRGDSEAEIEAVVYPQDLVARIVVADDG